MKRLKLLFLLVLLTGSFTRSMADVVSRETAAVVAGNFIYEQLVQQGAAISSHDITLIPVKTRESNGLPVYYAFNVSTGGFILVSAEDSYTPVIGYSTGGQFPEGEPARHFSSFLAGYDDQINYLRNNNIRQSDELKPIWDYYKSAMISPVFVPDGTRDLGPLLSNTWNQDFPYNAYCPLDPDGPGGHVYAGCVATTMSMIMAYYRYPIHGNGSFSYNYGKYGTISANFGETYYDWDAMLNSIYAGSGRAVNAIAELQFQCGVSVSMMYGADGSGAYSEDVPYAIKTYFGYSNSAKHLRKWNYTTQNWENMIIESIDALQPLYYAGQSSEGGHAFACDGYQNTGSGNLFHFNFGWSGSGNGFYTITDVGGFSSNQSMVRNFVPDPANYPYYCDDHVITSPMGMFEDGSGPHKNYEPGQNCTWLIAPEDSVKSISLTFNKFDLADGDLVKIYDGESNSAPLLAAYDNTSFREVVTTTGSRMFIELVAEGGSSAQGFDAEFSSTYPSFCGGTISLTDQTGSFSDGSGDYRYNHNSTCKWKIDPGQFANNLTLVFTSFDLEKDKDFVKVYALPSNQLLANLTGSEIPEPIVSPSGKMVVLFTSNGFNNNQGFDAEYYIANVATGKNEFVSGLSLYPNPAKRYVEVRFNLDEATESGFVVTDLTGRVVYSESHHLAQGFVNKVVQLGDLKPGIYLFTVRSEKGSISRKLVIE